MARTLPHARPSAGPAALALVVWLVARAGIAQAAPASSALRPAHADITLLGPPSATAAVQDVTNELLAREHVKASWASQAGFRPQDIFARYPAADSAAIAVWIDLSAPKEARLYFRDCRADRFFLRSLALERGIDEMAKEEIAHIVANAVSALSQGIGESLTRNEARIALQIQPTPKVDPVPSSTPTPWRGSVALLMGGRLFAHEVPLVAHTSGMVSVAHRLPGSRSGALGGWISLGHQFATDRRDDLVGATIQSTGLRAGVLWLGELSQRLTLGLGVGGGADRIRYSSQAIHPGVEAAAGDSFYLPALTIWAGLDVRLIGGLALTAHLSADAVLEGIHFDLHNSEGPASHVLDLYAFRPGAALGLMYIF